jgi:hypothetical protein
MTDTLFDPEHVEAEEHYLETISLLQDEVARLEGELLAQQALQPPPLDDPYRVDDSASETAIAGGLERDRLNQELAAREETICLLLDQLRLVEEAERSARAEWEQLAGWLSEVEERVDRRDQEEGGGAAERIAALQRNADAVRAAHARDREAWDRERRELKRENERLGSLLEEQASARPDKAMPDASRKLLQSEIQSLRQHCRELESESRREVQGLSESLESTRRELEEAHCQAALIEHERTRERREFEIAIAAVRTQTIRASLNAGGTEGSVNPARGVDASGALEADIRIREFREHLREIHSQEEQSRNQSRLSARLSRLWTRTAPASSGESPSRKRS